MTIDEAIRHAEEVAEEQEKSCEVYGSLKKHQSGLYERLTAENNEKKCAECAAEHRQIARWLRDLKMYQQRYLDALQLLKEATADFHKILPLISDCSFCIMYDKEKGECTGESALECADICAWRLHDKFLDVSF